METLLWNDNLSVGVKRFDDEHKHLIDFINRLNQALNIGSARNTMEEILSGLEKYTVIHFKHEEDMMLKHAYPAYDQHKKEHDILTGQVSDFFTRFKEGKAAFSLELMKFLNDWLLNHIQLSDKHYKSFFAGKGIS